MVKYINADRLKVTLLNFADRTKDMEDVGIGIGVHSCIHCLDEMPSADVRENTHGEWNLDGSCSVCGKQSVQTYGNFCSYCGADMKERGSNV